MLKKSFVPAVLAGILSIFSIVSCDVGLGETVDVTDPKVSVSYPPKYSVIREAFVLSGTSEDDKKVESVTVTAENEATGQSYSYEAELGSKNKWSVIINEMVDGKYPLGDGTYTITVVGKDGTGKTGKDVVTYEIDNTPPSFMIKNPGVTSLKNATTYGSVFKVDGEISDDHDVDSMTLIVYDADSSENKKLAEWNETSITTAGGTSVTFARYLKNEIKSDEEDSRYRSIYNVSEGDFDRSYYCTVKISDKAGIWRTPGSKVSDDSNTGLGNSTSTVWLYNDIYKEYMSKNSSYKFVISDLKNIENGNYSDKSFTDEQKNELLSLKKDTAISKLAFKLNKDASPKYSVFGYGVDGLNFSANHAGKAQNITFQAQMGLDKTMFTPLIENDDETFTSNLKLFMYGPFESLLSEEDINEIYDNPLVAYEKYIQTKQAILLYSADGKDFEGNSINELAPAASAMESLTVSVRLPEVIKKDCFYLFAAIGKDDDDESFRPSDNSYFGFVGVDDSNLYMLFDESAKNNATFNGQESHTVKGSISLSSLEDLELLERYAVVYNEETLKYEISKTPDAVWAVGNEDEQNSITVKETGDGSLEFTDILTKEQIGNETSSSRKVFRYNVKDRYNNEAHLEFNYYVDSKKPEVITINPEVWLSNSEVTLKVVVGDKGADGKTYSKGISKVSYKYSYISVKGAEPEEKTGELAPVKACDAFGDTGKDVPNKNYTLYQATNVDLGADGQVMVTFIAEDSVENISEKETSYKIDTTIPLITEVSAKIGNTDVVKDSIKIGKNSKGNIKYLITAKDDSSNTVGAEDVISGVAKYKVYKNGSEIKHEEINGGIEISLDNISEGSNPFEIRATDVAGNISDAVVCVVHADYTAPEVKYTSHEEGSSVNKFITLAGTVTDNNAVKGFVKLQVKNSEGWTDISSAYYKSASCVAGKWSVVLDTTKFTDEDELIVRAVVNDIYDNESEGDGIRLCVEQDSDRPEINLTNINTSGSAIKLSKTVLGTVSDDDGPIKGIYFINSASYDANTLPQPGKDDDSDEVIKNNGWTKASGLANWSANAENEGETSWYFAVIDAEDSVFHIKDEDELKRPYVKGMEGEKTDLQIPVSFDVDMNPPAVTMYVAHGEASNRQHNSDGKFSSAGEVFGGTNNYVWIKLEVVEEVGMDGETGKVLTGCKVPSVEINGVPYDSVEFYSTPTVIRKGDIVEDKAAEVTKYTYLLKGIDVSSYPDGNLPIKCTVSDSSGQTGVASMNVTVDNTAPDVYIVSPTTSLSDAVNSAISVKGVVSDAAAGTDKIYWLIPENEVSGGKVVVKTYNGSEGDWTQVPASASWEITFASGAADSTDSLLYYANAQITSGGVSYPRYAISSTDTEGVYKVPVYFFVTDKAGNKSVRTQYKEEDLYVLVDSEGGLPKAWINSPEAGSTTSGVVTIYGGASDNVSVNKVLLQFDANGDGVFDDGDKNLCETNFNLTVSDETFKDKEGKSVTTWSVSTSGTNSWKTQIDTKYIPKVAGKTTVMRVRVRGVDSDTQSREWSDPYEVKIDAASPTIKDIKLVQYGKGVTPSASTKPVTEREYLSGIYISNISAENNGPWYLTCTIADEDGKVSTINNSTLSDSSINIIPLASESDLASYGTTSDSGKSYSMRIPLNTTASGRIYARIDASDNASNGTSKEILINIDSTPPSLYNISNSETTKASVDSLRLKSLGKMLGNGTNVTSNYASVVNNNNFFTFGDTVSEAGSGLQYIAFYFERDGKSEKRVYNPMLSGTSAKSVISSTRANGNVYINSDGLAALYLSGLTRTSDDSLTMSASNPNVRVGGLVKIAGNYSRITKVSGSTVSFTPGCDKSLFTDAEIVVAQVVDHMLSESIDTDNVSVINDDGDEMVESISQIGSGYIWSASVNSTNIPDGPVQIHVVAIDNAGNVNSGYISTVISNNRPRLTKVMLGTDLNGNGKYDLKATSAPIVSVDSEKATADGKSYGEFSYYSAFNKQTGLGQYDVELTSENFKVISGLMVVPEFTGGNHNLKYVLTYGDKASGPVTSADPIQMATRSALKTLITEQNKPMFGNSETAAQNVISYKDYDFGGLSLGSDHDAFKTDKKTYLNLTFWDATEETTQGTDSQWALLKIPVTVKSNDQVSPVAKIRPFYWNGNSENSVYKDSKGVLQGHIELESNLSAAVISSLGETNPKVSGKVMVEGIITDDVRLSSITANVFGNSGTVGNYSNGTWVENSTLPTGVVSFSATDLDMSQNGHTVKYSMVVDTEQLTGAAGKDKVITVGATDWKNNGSEAEADSTQTASNTTTVNEVVYPTGTTNKYTMDVVPYITQIWTGLSETKPNNPSMYARASTGEYVVRGKTSGATYNDASTAGETITVYGWNLNGTPTLKLGNATISGTTVAANSNENVKQGTYGISFTVPDSTSNAVTVTVNGITNLNNINNNDARGSAAEDTDDYEGYYNRQPNGDNNNTLTDDVKLDIWEFKNAVTPAGTAAKYVHMKVGPYLSGDASRSGRIGFSFRNGAGFFNMPGYMYSAGQTTTINTMIKKQVDLYINTNLNLKAIHYWGDSISGDTSNPISLGSPVSYNSGNYYHITFSTALNAESDGSLTDMKFLLTPNVGNWSEQTGNIQLSTVGEYIIDVVPSGTIRPTHKSAYIDSKEISGDALYSQTKIGQNFQGFSHNTFTWDANGESYGAALCSDTSGNDDMSANFQFFSRGYGESGDSLNFNYYNCTNGRRIENTKNAAGTYDEERVKSPSMATFVADGKTYVYMAYWDHLENRIIYRVGSVGGTGSSNANDIGLGLRDLCGETFHHANYDKSNDTGKIGSSGYARRNSTDSSYVGDSRTGEADAYHYVNVLESFAGVTDAYVSVAALSDGSAVVAWYDDVSSSLKAVKISKADMLSQTMDAKSYTPVTVSGNGGAYVALVADSEDGLHFAYSSNSGANLYYAYANSSLSSITEMLVDVSDDVGDNCTIDVARKDTSSPWIPTITYKSNVATKTKIAYPVFASSAQSSTRPTAGSTSGGQYTGVWTICTLPTSNKSISDLVSVGYNKNWSNGTYQNFAAVEEIKTTTTGKYTICNSSIVSGNGTSNPVVGYAIATGSIEMAQKK